VFGPAKVRRAKIWRITTPYENILALQHLSLEAYSTVAVEDLTKECDRSAYPARMGLAPQARRAGYPRLAIACV
jgi:hypothetical protein